MCLSRISYASYWIFSETFSNCDLAEFQVYSFEIILRGLRCVSQPKFNCIIPKLLWGVSKMCIRWNSIASYWIKSKTFSNCISAEIRLNPIEIILKRSRIVSSPNSFYLVPEMLQGISKLCLSWCSIESYWNFSKTFSKCPLAEFHLQRIEKFAGHFQIVS